MQQFTNIQSTDTLTNSRAELVNNDLTVLSNSSGTSFPTTNLQQGMFCLRTDLLQIYMLVNMTPTWELVFDLNYTATNQQYVNGQIALCAPAGFGLGATATLLAAASNLNNLISSGSGFFRGTSLTNAPDAGWWHIIHIAHDEANWATQIAIAIGSGNTYAVGTMLNRQCVNGAWGAWQQHALINSNITGTAANVTGTVALANGGTGATSAQAAINTLAGAVTNGYFLRGNGTNVVMSPIQASDVPALNQNTTGNAATCSNASLLNGLTAAQIAANMAAYSGSQQGSFSPSDYIATNIPDVGVSLNNVYWYISSNTLTQNPGVGAGTYSMQGAIQQLINLSHSHGTANPASSVTINCNCNCCSCCG